MRKPYTILMGAMIGLATITDAQAQCVGDCNDDGTVAINEVITCVNIGLELLPLTQCSACDGNGDGMVTINEIITSVNIGLGLLPCGGETPTVGPNPTPTSTRPPSGDAICGNEIVEAGEDCDDGNNFGGDGCATNCTDETRRDGTLTENSGAVAKSQFLPFILPLRGTTTLTTGKPRDVDVVGKDGTIVTRAGQIPVITKAADVRFNPVSLTGLVCACVRGIPVPELFGPGNSGMGLIGCNPEGLMDVDFLVEQDHNTTPGDPGNSGSENGLPDDSDCTASSELGDGVVSNACLEGTGEACSAINFEHIGVCNSPRVLTRSGGPGGRGSMFMLNSSAIGLLADRGMCGTNSMDGQGNCLFRDYGPDCLPCTDDDLEKGTPSTSPLTSGTGRMIVYDSNNQAGVSLEPDELIVGQNANCDVFDNPQDDGLEGTNVTGFPGLDADQIGDTVTTTIIESR